MLRLARGISRRANGLGSRSAQDLLESVMPMGVVRTLGREASSEAGFRQSKGTGERGPFLEAGSPVLVSQASHERIREKALRRH